MDANRVWLAADLKNGHVHVMEHEADYDKGDMLVLVTAGVDGVGVRILPEAKE